MFVTASAGQAREQLASGARVVGPLGSGMSADSVRDQVEAARAARPRGLTEIRAGLRDIFAEHATPARLAALVRAAGLPASLVGGRQVAVLARVTDAAQAGRLADALLRQRLRPAEVVVATGAGDPVRDALAALADHGIRVVTTDAGSGAGPAGRTGRARWPGWPARRGSRRGSRHRGRTARSRTRTCSTWPVPGSARRRTRSGSAPTSTSSPTGSTSPPWPVAACSPPRARRPRTGAVMACGFSPSPVNPRTRS